MRLFKFTSLGAIKEERCGSQIEGYDPSKVVYGFKVSDSYTALINAIKIGIQRLNVVGEREKLFIRRMYGLPTRPPAENIVRMANGC